MDLSTLVISNDQKVNLLFQLRLLNEYLDRSENLLENEIEFLKRAFPELIGLLPIKTDPIKNFSIPFERLVINKTVCGANKRITKLEQLRYPPREIAYKLDYNRASLKGQTIFYAGSRGMLPIIVETQPKRGDLITKSKWQFNKGHILNLLVICQDEGVALSNPYELLENYNQYQNELGRLHGNTREVVQAVYQFIIKAFTRKVDSNRRQGYVFSALLADLFFTHTKYPVDAIYYPSVPNKGAAMNIAVKPDAVDKMFTMIEASESIIMKNPEQGEPGWYSFSTGKCKSYNQETLELNWENQIIPETDPVNIIMKEYNIDIS